MSDAIDIRPPQEWVSYPALVPLERASVLAMMPAVTYQATVPEGDPREALSKFFVRPLPSWLSDGDIGGVRDLFVVHENVAAAGIVLERMVGDFVQSSVRRGLAVSRRLVVATRLISYGARQVSAAHVMHMREEAFHQVSALSLTRTAIELIGRGGWVAIGEGTEPDQAVYGPRLPTHGQRRKQEINTTRCMEVIERKARRAWPEADAPLSVLRWLNQFTHFDGRVVDLLGSPDAERLRSDTYAATAYVAWLAAAMTGVVLGRETVARIPRLPKRVPWCLPSPGSAAAATKPKV